MKKLSLVIIILWAILSILCIFLILYSTEIKTCCLKGSGLVIGDPIINRETYKIVLINADIIEYMEMMKYINNEQYTVDWAILHEEVKPDNSRNVLSQPVLRWAARIQKLTGKRLADN